MRPIRTCNRCGTRTEVFADQAADAVACPQCGNALAPTAMGALPTQADISGRPVHLPPGTRQAGPTPQPGSRRPTAAFLVDGADKPERRVRVALLVFPIVLVLLIAIVWWEPWKGSTTVPDTEVAVPTVSETLPTPPVESYEAPVARRPPVSLQPATSATKPAQLTWNGTSLPRFELPRGVRTQTAASGSFPRFLAIDGAVYQLRDGQKIANHKLSGVPLRIAVSSEGDHAAVVELSDKSQAVVLHKTSQDSAPRTIRLSEKETPVRYLAFAGSNKLVAQLGFGGGSKLQVWDTSSGAVLEQIEAPSINEYRAALSKGGEKIAIVGAASIEIISTRGGAQIASLTHPSHMDTVPLSLCRGVAFSHEGSRLAALFPNNRLVVWALDGSLLLDHTLVLQDDSSRGLQWLPDDSGWLLHGNTICLANPVLSVWQVAHRPGYAGFRHLVVDAEHMLVAGGTSDRGRLVGIKVPWREIRQRCKQPLSRQPLFGAPPAVHLLVKVGETRFAAADEVREKIADRVSAALRSQGVDIQESAECMLVVDYSEAAGSIAELTVGGVKREETGTRCRVTAALSFRRGGVPLWSKRLDFDSGTREQGDLKIIVDDYATERDLRNSAFTNITSRLDELRLPSVVFDDRGNPLPIKTTL